MQIQGIYGDFSKIYEQIKSIYAERKADPIYSAKRPAMSKKTAGEIRKLAFEAIRVFKNIKDINHDEYAEYREVEKRSNALIAQVQDLLLMKVYDHYPFEEHWKKK